MSAKRRRSRRPTTRAAAHGNRRGERNILLALSWYYPAIHRGVARFARDHGWHVTADFDDLVPTHWNGDGVLTLLGARENIWRSLRKFGVPTVDLAESRPNIPLPRVTMDNGAIGRMAADHFLQRGYRHFAFVHRWDLGVSRRRRDAFQGELAKAGFSCETLCWQKEGKGTIDARPQRHRWLIHRLRALRMPLAVFATRDAEAVEVIEACLSAGITVPDQVAVLGVDNTEMICDCLRVPLSSIDANMEHVGYEGAALLERLLSGARPPKTPVYVAPSAVIERRSTDHLAVDHAKVAAALRFIHDNAHEQIAMGDVIKYVSMSRSGLEKAFREHFVRAPIHELRRVRVERAKEMLLKTDKKIAAIARLAGFQTPHNLCRTFKQQLGMTPKEFRLQH